MVILYDFSELYSLTKKTNYRKANLQIKLLVN